MRIEKTINGHKQIITEVPTVIIINESHKITPSQQEELDEFETYNAQRHSDDIQYEILKVPKKGWSHDEMREQLRNLQGKQIIFVSPIPYMIHMASLYGKKFQGIQIFCNDNREKVEKENGEVYYKLQEDGWALRPFRDFVPKEIILSKLFS